MFLLKICIAGYGNVGKEFCKLLSDKNNQIFENYQCRVQIVGIYAHSKGTLINRKGLDLEKIFQMYKGLQRFDNSDEDYHECTAVEMIRKCGADVFVELSPLSIKDGQPAIEHICAAFDKDMHVISANKGPIAWDFARLTKISKEKNLQFLYETTVMDGTPIFNLYKRTLHGNRISKITGILNGTTNYILSQLENGLSFESAVNGAKAIGLAEADPSMDIDGWDGAAKLCILANALMEAEVTPDMVEVKSLRDITIEGIHLAKNEGYKIKYLCEATRDEITNEINLRVYPKKININDIYSNVNGTSAAITLFTDLSGELIILQQEPGLLQTAYGVYSDLLTVIKNYSLQVV